MSAKYWIKLYHEVLHDPKMGMLPDNLWRRTIELFLLAGELSIDSPEDERGHLPTTDEIAWLLRQSAADLQKELEQLSRVNIVTQTETGWLVTKFAERQKAVKADERMRQYRERKRKDKPISDEPETKEIRSDKDIVTRSVTKRNIEVESDKELIPKGIGDKSPEPDTSKKQLMGIFLEETGLKMPHRKSDIGFWWSAINEIYGLVDNNIGLGGNTIRQVVRQMRNDKLTISSPNSIVNLCRALCANAPPTRNGHKLDPEKDAIYQELMQKQKGV